MVDGGPGGPDHLMAHAHADLFSYELSLFGERFVVDTGVYEYPAGPMRQYVRSTAAHNTASVDGVDQIECWDSFRVARRAAPNDVTWETSGKQARSRARSLDMLGGLETGSSIDANSTSTERAGSSRLKIW